MPRFNKLIPGFVAALLLLFCVAAYAQAPANTMDATVMYSELHSNAPVGGCGCFWMEGGTGEFTLPVWKNFSFVTEIGGQHTDHIPGFNAGLSIVSFTGGMRMRVPTHTIFQPFGQALFGGAHAFDTFFPAKVGSLPTSSDTSFAMVIGGGVDLGISKHIWIRVIQADYHYTQFPNLEGDRQNSFRLSAGLVFRTTSGRH